MNDVVVNLGITLFASGLICLFMEYLHRKKIKQAEDIYNIRMKALEARKNDSVLRGRQAKQKK